MAEKSPWDTAFNAVAAWASLALGIQVIYTIERGYLVFYAFFAAMAYLSYGFGRSLNRLRRVARMYFWIEYMAQVAATIPGYFAWLERSWYTRTKLQRLQEAVYYKALAHSYARALSP